MEGEREFFYNLFAGKKFSFSFFSFFHEKLKLKKSARFLQQTSISSANLSGEQTQLIIS